MMISDVLGVVIAFISIMLLLSILVTALVQTTQAALRLRSRNLMKGLAGLIMKAKEVRPDDKKAQRQAKRDAAEVLNAPNIALLNRVDDATTFWQYWVFGPRVSWVDPEDLPTALKRTFLPLEKPMGPHIDPEDDIMPDQEKLDKIEEITADFRKIERPLQKRFKFIVRWWTFAFGLLVAFVFQVSTPHLLGRLAQDSERRERIVADAEDLLAHQAETLANISYDSVAPEALEKLQEQYPDQRELIEEASGVGTTRYFLLEELRLALEGVPNSEEIVEAYDALLDKLAEEKQVDLRGEVDSTLERLASYDIVIWKRGWSFYYDTEAGLHGNALLGVLVTAILLSLGAPFWYERLREAIFFRDVLAPKKREGEGEREGDRSGSADGTSPDRPGA